MSADPSRAWLSEARRAARPFLFTTVDPFVHNVLNLGALVAVVAVIVGAVALGARIDGPLYVLVAGPVLGLCFFTLISLVVHEASHGMFVLAGTRARTRAWNRVFGWACALPFAIHYVNHWEVGHNLHHARPLEDDDPQRFNTRTGADLLRTVLALVCVPLWAYVHRYVKKRPGGSSRSSPAVMVAFVALWATVMPGLYLALGPWVPVAVLWGLQITAAINELKGALEHGRLAGEPDHLLRSRSTLPPLPWLFGPLNASVYHFEHHLHAAVPWYRLPAYHRAIRDMVPPELRDDVFNRRPFRQLAGALNPHGANQAIDANGEAA